MIHNIPPLGLFFMNDGGWNNPGYVYISTAILTGDCGWLNDYNSMQL